MKTTTSNSICILRLSAIGDCINALAAVQCIARELNPESITWLVGKNEATLFSKIPGINLVTYDKKAGLKGFLDVKKQLNNQKFTCLLDMQSALRASMLSLCVKAERKLGFDATRACDGQRFFTNEKVTSPDFPHVLDGFMAFAGAIGCQDLTPKWNFHLDDDDYKVAQKYIKPEDKTLIIAPCTSKRYKNWTTIGYVEIARYALTKGFKVILCGGPSYLEREISNEIEQTVKSEQVLNLVGQTSLREMLGLIAKASLVVAPDSGPVHMANAVGTPVIGLYAHHNPQRVGPRNFLDYVVSVYDDCIKEEHPNPSEIKWRTRVHDKSAMQKINTNMVKKSFDRICADFNLE